MSSEVQPQIPPLPSSLSMIRTLGLIAMISGLLVVMVVKYTDPIIKEKERLALEQAVFQVIPSVDTKTATRVSFALNKDGLKRLDEHEGAGEANMYAVYDGAGKLLGIALQAAAQGYQDVVRTLFGYNPDCQCIVGMTIMKSTDTPGMGDKHTIENNKAFMANFTALSAALATDQSKLAHPIEAVTHGTKTDPWQVDAISGATISSRAIAKGLNTSAQKMLPLVTHHLPVLLHNSHQANER
ncbi:MAG: FMN-binding protein [Gammaproteobacteria bacterium]|nr:FMN-binding protein [Gammaproteobacteria bacterium]MCB1861269.1 FMN-binding protein [Gammaproteobacteria bacterium]MCB1872298.1 FMN-binding protein [Gammaproteobacteria bacterium]MCB1879397.1 FMN-binding protein [Gammaproteobacteria bacterium]MCB1904786.1 FMN-binding protein [Gammaproteobacteria bacterium]